MTDTYSVEATCSNCGDTDQKVLVDKGKTNDEYDSDGKCDNCECDGYLRPTNLNQ